MDCYVDADWAGDIVDRKSTTGFVIRLFGNAVYWKSKKQMTVTKSSTFAEYIALSEAVTEISLLRSILDDVFITLHAPVNIYEDNSGAVAIAKYGNFTKNSKHIEVHYHYVHENVKNGTIDIVKVDSEDNDIFVHLCTVDDSLYFMCNTEAFKFLAEMIQHVPLPLRARYVFCCAPINNKLPFVCASFLKKKQKKIRPSLGIEPGLGNPYRAAYTHTTDGQRLLRNSEQVLREDSEDNATSLRLRRGTKALSHHARSEEPKGKLSEILVSKGLITPQMLKKLQQELVIDKKPEKGSIKPNRIRRK
ncbi:hypothetical protein MSG28_001468 [Choristoneura fumiferana]|uniref:Uncharacterized protein n=1 Tax=Choristoneura fumiferana TaxID=7141 RepID=A0ACC0KUM4_CHOFU|nr:hypothetical protein MSG28_001468 [Choristoneura fumiferana]